MCRKQKTKSSRDKCVCGEFAVDGLGMDSHTCAAVAIRYIFPHPRRISNTISAYLLSIEVINERLTSWTIANNLWRKGNVRIVQVTEWHDDAITKLHAKLIKSTSFWILFSKWFFKQTQKLFAFCWGRVWALIILERKMLRTHGHDSIRSARWATTRFAAKSNKNSRIVCQLARNLKTCSLFAIFAIRCSKWNIRFTPSRQINTKHLKRRKLLSFHLRWYEIQLSSSPSNANLKFNNFAARVGWWWWQNYYFSHLVSIQFRVS